jgi:ATP-dependent helicase/nuclease subunit A
MSDKKWTDEQLRAITAEKCNLLVSAAAGAGKTAVLVERIIRKVTDKSNPIDVDKFLVVTFTRAAAAEMRERIGRALGAVNMNRQMVLLNRAAITTLHSFCLDILRQYFYKIDLDPAFRVGDETETILLRLESIEELFEEYYLAEDEAFLALVDAYGGDRDDANLQSMVLKLYEYSCSNPWPEYWLQGLASGYTIHDGIPLEEHQWAQVIMQWLESRFNGMAERLVQSLNVALGLGGPTVYGQVIKEDIEFVKLVARAVKNSWQQVYDTLNSMEFAKLKACNDKSVDESMKNYVKKTRDEVKKEVNNIKSELFTRPPNEICDDLQKVEPVVRKLGEIVLKFGEGYKKKKSEKSIVDFSDLEHLCLKVLISPESLPGKAIPSPVALEIRAAFDEVFIDEYQDINGVQETVLRMVTGDGQDTQPNRFMVGDVKQSIYRFRMAEPSLFMEKYNSYPRDTGGCNLGIDLTHNFRSRADIVSAVNFIFSHIMTSGTGEIDYDAKAELFCAVSYPDSPVGLVPVGGPVELCLLEKNNTAEVTNTGEAEESSEEFSGKDTPNEELTDSVQKEARYIAQRILELISGKTANDEPKNAVFDLKNSTYRPVSFKDIVVLLRATQNTANVFMEEFRAMGIPAYADIGTGYFAATEVETLLSLLKIIDNPRQDIPLASVLRSTIVGLTEQEMAEIRLLNKKSDYYDCVLKAADTEGTETAKKLVVFLADMEKWRTMSRREPLSELIWRIYTDTGYYAYVGGMPGGAQRQANLRALYDRARQFESTSFKGLFRFLRFIEKILEAGQDIGTARYIGENEDVVRIISIHKSKGLEYPVVFVAGLGRQFNMMDLRRQDLIHKTLGLGLPVVDTKKRLMYPTVIQQAIKIKLRQEMMAEEMRVLYVAMTRAREKLILVGSVNGLNKHTLTETAVTYLDWLRPVLTKPGHNIIINEVKSDRDIYQSQLQHSFGDFLEVIKKLEKIDTEDKWAEIIDFRLNWQYPYTYITQKPAKMTVTEIKRRFADQTEDFDAENYSPVTDYRRPLFVAGKRGLTATEKGSALHLVMQNIKLKMTKNRIEISDQIKEMADKQILTGEQAASVNVEALEKFFADDLGQKMQVCRSLKREVPFTMLLPLESVYGSMTPECAEEKILVQGIIDCLIEEENGYILVDYKTDAVTPGKEEEMVKRYSGQMNLYAQAVEIMLKKPVNEKYLYLFSAGRAVRCG